jgi:hypothetical protein
VPVDRRLAGLHHDLAEQDDEEQAEALGEVVGVERLGRILRAERREVVVAPQPVRRRTVLGQHRARLAADGDRPQRVAEGLGRRRGEGEEGRRAQAGPRDPLAQHVAAPAGDRVGARQDQARDGEAEGEDRAVAGRRGFDRHRGDADGDARGEEQQPLQGLVVAEAVVEDGEPHPRPPQRDEQPEGDPHAAHLGLGDDEVRELGDREHEDEVEVQLDPRDALALAVHQPRCPRPRSRPARVETPS